MEQEARFVGIDVSKAKVDVGVRPTGQRWVVSYDETGIGELVFQLVDLSPALVLLEASGGLELPLVAALAAAALPVVVVNPRQVRDFARATGTLALNAVAEWRTLDTSSIARLFPFSPPDLDTRRETLYGIDMRACAPVVYAPWDGTHLNANTAVLARSGSGKSFATKLGMLRGLTRGITAYVIDPEGEYADTARAAGGRVLSPGIPGQGMNPFVIDKGDSEELLQRIGSLRRLIEVMVG